MKMKDIPSKTKMVLGALLHDIGKFKQRAALEEDNGSTHVQIGYEWLKDHYGEGIISAGARNHHGNEPETWESNISLIIYEADNCSAAERKKYDPQNDKGKEWHRKIQLANVFSRIRDPVRVKDGSFFPSMSYYPLGVLGEWIEPLGEEGANDKDAYRRLWAGFSREFDILKRKSCHYNVEAIAHLLEKYTSFIPAITLKVYGGDDAASYRKHPDISLFDHLKITAATASCLYDYYAARYQSKFNENVLKDEITNWETSGDTNSAPLLLIGGDISGVQNFIYTISSKGALKSLKGRSFYLELLIEHTVDMLLEGFDQTRCNIIFTGGGHFYLLAPNSETAQKTVAFVRSRINDYLFKSFNASLQMHIDFVPFLKQNFSDASGPWRELGRKIESSKQRKWEHHLEDLLDEPAMPEESCLTRNCEICGREDQPLNPLSDDKSELLSCQYCREQYLLGSSLQAAARKKNRVVIYRMNDRPAGKNDICINDCFYHIGESYKDDVGKNASAVFHLNDWDLSNYVHPHSRPLMAGVFFPEDCRELEDMALEGFGMNRIGVLKMDVDNLGTIFSQSLPENERTLSRMASLSRNMSLFFKYHINGILGMDEGYPTPFLLWDRKDVKRYLTIVYSGGDDLFLIGHWLDILESSFDINAALRRLTANPYITVSGGIILGDSHDPIYHLAHQAHTAEKAAKSGTKQSITIFSREHVFKWNLVALFQERIRSLADLFTTEQNHLGLPEGPLSRSMLHRMLLLFREHREKNGAVWLLPHLAYLFGRFRPSEGFEKSWSSLKDYVFSTNVDWHHLEMVVLLILMMMRKEKDKQ
ncbi:CRISPR-associated protein Csm1 [anaerobic digester metagenome]|jgi:CRISPR-associated protein Csm1|uniref:CRISPR system single-strand-specific deoxyribonuclease Cas10/Csm1 (subtype III-A) n=1 Tax=anaerobic digester metagenome TaxID=1263854 RepID=A0A485MD05_9ZZZZ